VSHIKVPEGAPGIVGPMLAYPDSARILNQLAGHLLSQETPTFSKGERETVAGYVSYLNNCIFCSESHGAVADYHEKKPGFSKVVWKDMENAPLSNRLKALLRIAAKVQKDGRTVSKTDVDAAIKLGSTERDIHDTVLIAAAFCMFNRYVDGLGTSAPERGSTVYTAMGEMLATKGYGRAV
jgi:uncharacterized peroxidase-related enzyme